MSWLVIFHPVETRAGAKKRKMESLKTRFRFSSQTPFSPDNINNQELILMKNLTNGNIFFFTYASSDEVHQPRGLIKWRILCVIVRHKSGSRFSSHKPLLLVMGLNGRRPDGPYKVNMGDAA